MAVYVSRIKLIQSVPSACLIISEMAGSNVIIKINFYLFSLMYVIDKRMKCHF